MSRIQIEECHNGDPSNAEMPKCIKGSRTGCNCETLAFDDDLLFIQKGPSFFVLSKTKIFFTDIIFLNQVLGGKGKEFDHFSKPLSFYIKCQDASI